MTGEPDDGRPTDPFTVTDSDHDPDDAEDTATVDPQTVADPPTVEELIAGLEAVTRERDEHLEQLQRNQAEFENVRRRLRREVDQTAEAAASRLAETLLPVLDACDSAIGHGSADVEPIFAALLGTLEKEGLGRVAEPGVPFDPNVHEAVFHEPAEAGDDTTVVTEIMRAGYTWGERTLRPAMV